jgi:uncharacterized membrane protein YcaP (DUF421 family)
MDLVTLGRVAIRALTAYLFLLALLRLGGRQSIRHGTPFDFVLALILGDLVDNAIWAEVPFAQFAIASTTLVVSRLLVSPGRMPLR